MKRAIALVVFATFLLSGVAAQEPKDKEAKEPRWTALDLGIQTGDELLPTYNGTRITALLHFPERFIVGIDAEKSTVKITDDKSTDLMPKLSDSQGIIREVRLSQDGKFSSMVFRASGIPAKQAAKIRVKGSVAVMVAKNEKQIERKDVSFATPVDLQFGTLKGVKISAGRDNMLVYQGMRPLKTVVVLNADGQEITYKLTSSYEPLSAKRGEFRTGLLSSTTKKVSLERCILRVTYFETVERVVVPIDLEVGFGL